MKFQYVGSALGLFQIANTTGLTAYATTALTWAQDSAAKMTLDSLTSGVASEYIDKARALYQNVATTGLTQHATTAVTWAHEYPVKDTLDSLTPSMVSERVDKALVLYQSVATTGLAEHATSALIWAQDHPVQVGVTTLLGLFWALGIPVLPALVLRGAGFGEAGVGVGRFHMRWSSISYHTH